VLSSALAVCTSDRGRTAKSSGRLRFTGPVPAPDVRLRTAPTADLSRTTLVGVRRLLDEAFAGRFDDEDWAHALGGLHVLATVDGELAGHAAVVGRQLIAGGRTLRTGYVEAVATSPRLRRRGAGAAVMAEVERLVTGGAELGALASSALAVPFYRARGWTEWTGPTAALTPDGVVETPDEVVFVLRTAATPVPLEPAGRLVCDWRRGDLW
jgi:aminoglycoside 2'-N-acetyltransferase I